MELVSPLQCNWIYGWLYISRSVTAHWNMASLSEAKSLKKTGSPLDSYQLPISLQWGGWFCDHLPSLRWICLARIEFICELPDYVPNHGFVSHPWPMALRVLLLPLPHRSLNLRERRLWYKRTIYDWAPTLHHSLHPDQIWVSVNSVNSCVNWERRFPWCTKQVWEMH